MGILSRSEKDLYPLSCIRTACIEVGHWCKQISSGERNSDGRCLEEPEYPGLCLSLATLCGELLPEMQVWILHGGDHFTVAWAAAATPAAPGSQFTSLDRKNSSGKADDLKSCWPRLYHWNGLPPGDARLRLYGSDDTALKGGPRLAELKVNACKAS